MGHPHGPPPAPGAWRILLARAEEAAAHRASLLAEAFAELVRVAHTEPRLRRLHPWTGMWELHFSRCTEHPLTWDIPYIGTSADGRYRVEGPSRSSPRITETGCARVAVAQVVEHLPPGCGPAFEGSAHELAVHERARDGSGERA